MKSLSSNPAILFCLFLIIASALTSMTYVLLGNTNPDSMIIGIAFSSLAAVVLSLSLDSMRRTGIRRSIYGSLISSMNSALFYNASGIPLARSVRLCAKQNSPPQITLALTALSNKLRLGMSFSDSFASTPLITETGFLKKQDADALGIDGIREALNLHELNLNDQLSRIEASIQKYATANMFIAVLLPCFALFALISNYVISQGSNDPSIMYFVVLDIIPSMYVLGSLVLSRRLNG